MNPVLAELTKSDKFNEYLERIKKYNDQYNALITINENAINEAKELDKERQNGNIKSSIHGIPIIVKENIDVLGTATTAGSKALSDNYPNEDALIIQKLKEAGAMNFKSIFAIGYAIPVLCISI